MGEGETYSQILNAIVPMRVVLIMTLCCVFCLYRTRKEGCGGTW